MEKFGKQLTDRELIEVLVAWYKFDHSTEQLRDAVAAYVHQNANKLPPLSDSHTIDESLSNTVKSHHTIDSGFSAPKPDQVTYNPQFEPTDELIGTRGWSIDAWALYYGIEEFFHKISFGLLNMQAIAVLFCLAISATVMFGAWQSMLSTERQKKAAFKTIVPELDKGLKDVTFAQQRTQTDSTGSIPESEPVSESPTIVASTSVIPEPIAATQSEFSAALLLMENSDWNNALAELQTLEQTAIDNSQPLLTLLRVEALIQKHDTESMELARQLLMDCEFGEYATVYDLLVARWMLLSSGEDRKRFLNEIASLPDSTRRRMSTWAQIRNGAKDAMTEVTLDTNKAKGPNEVCDLLFLASYHFNVGKLDETRPELLVTQQKLRALKPTGNNHVESWLLDAAKRQLSSKIDDILSLVNRQPRKPIN